MMLLLPEQKVYIRERLLKMGGNKPPKYDWEPKIDNLFSQPTKKVLLVIQGKYMYKPQCIEIVTVMHLLLSTTIVDHTLLQPPLRYQFLGLL